jgi:SagB-type dehydrogenase family enzyme
VHRGALPCRACADLDGLPAGLYHHDPGAPGLRRLRAGDQRAIVNEAAAGEPALAAAPAALLLTSAFWRNAWKYGPRAYRHTFWDGGVLLANVLAAAQALGLPARLVLGFEDDRIARLLDLDPEREAPFALVALGSGGPPAPEAPDPAPLGFEDEPLYPLAQHFAEIPAAHAATSLRSTGDVARWRAAAPPPKRWTEIRGGGATGGEPTIEEAIVGRRSTRSFAATPIGQGQLRLLLDAALAPIPADVAVDPGKLHLAVNAVEGMEPGLYGVERGQPVLMRAMAAAELRRTARAMAVAQELGGSAAVDFCFLADLDDALGRMGDRGWRAAHLGASIAAGRVEVAAQAIGIGATGLTFYDDEVVELFGLDPERIAVAYLAAAGVPWRPGLPSGLPEHLANLALDLAGGDEPIDWDCYRLGEVELAAEPDGLRVTLGEGGRLELDQTVAATPGRARVTARLQAERVAGGAATLVLSASAVNRPLVEDRVELRADGSVDAELAIDVPPRARSVRIALVATGPATLRLGALTLYLG